MRSLFIALIFSLLAQPSFARERAFRVVGDTAIGSGYALAWGMKGKNLDFEELDKLPDPRVFFEDNQDKLVNYLVDLENETIVDTVLEPALVGRAGGSHVLHNHDTIDLVSVPLKGGEYEDRAMFLMANHKWSNEITKLMVVKRGDVETTAIFESKSIGNDIENAILNKLSAADRTKYIKYAGAVSWYFRTEVDANYIQRLVVDAEAIHPKKDDPSLLIQAKIRLLLKDDNLQVQVDSASLHEQK